MNICLLALFVSVCFVLFFSCLILVCFKVGRGEKKLGGRMAGDKRVDSRGGCSLAGCGSHRKKHSEPLAPPIATCVSMEVCVCAYAYACLCSCSCAYVCVCMCGKSGSVAAALVE